MSAHREDIWPTACGRIGRERVVSKVAWFSGSRSVAWTAGRYHKLDRWVLDEATARKVIAGVEQEFEKAPDALFRYKVVGELGKLK
jgi:hypothetical protein